MSKSSTISVLITGSEITDGRVVDTNANLIARHAFDLGIKFDHFLACDDSFESIKRSITFLLEHSTILIVSGGLGPTSDDCTREAIADLFCCPLEEDKDALNALEELYRARRRRMDQSNMKQATFPRGAQVISNPVGTAAAFELGVQHQGTPRVIFALPGVPHEFERIFTDSLLAKLRETQVNKPPTHHTFLRVFGLPESTVGERVKGTGVPAEIQVSYRAHFPEIQLLFKSTNQTLLQEWLPRIEQALGSDFIFSRDPGRSLEQEVHDLLLERCATIATAESCTAGMISTLLTSCAGSSNYFLGGELLYSNKAKSSVLRVPHETLQTHGAVSHEVARSLAQAAKDQFGSSYAISITGISGPGGGSEEKPVGTFFVGVATADELSSYRFYFPGERWRTRIYEAHMALDVLRRTLLKLPIRQSQALER